MSEKSQTSWVNRPPIQPKLQKASSFRRSSSRNSLRQLSKNHQREQKTSNKETLPSKYEQNTQSLESIESNVRSPLKMPPKGTKRQLINEQYQNMPIRKVIVTKNRINVIDFRRQSRLTDNTITNRSLSKEEEQKRSKSKSSLNYAKYFIRQVSNDSLTNPSYTVDSKQDSSAQIAKNVMIFEQSNEQIKNIQKERDMPSKQISQEISVQQHKRPQTRNSITERLKSLKKLRSKRGQKISSLSKNSLQKQKKEASIKKQKLDKIKGNITSLVDQQYNILRMKARNRNKKIMIKIKQLKANKLASYNFCLEMSSKIDRSFSQRKQCNQKIELHLQILNYIPSYVKEFKEIYEESECWQELIFLVYKKFFIERLKVQYALSFIEDQKYPEIYTSNPFRFEFCEISDENLSDFKNTHESMQIQQRISIQNKQIEQALRNLYNHIIQKSGNHINLIEKDNFSQEIYLLMNQEFKLLEQSNGNKQVRLKRMNFIIKIALTIGFLNGQISQVENFMMENEFNQKSCLRYKEFIGYYIKE